MAALATAAERKIRNRGKKDDYEPVVATGATIYQGGLVTLDTTTGRAKAAAAATGHSDVVLGIAEETKTGDTAGTVRCKVTSGYEALFAGHAALTVAYLGVNAAVKTDNDVSTASNAGTAAVQVIVGRVVEQESTGNWWVAVGNIAKNNV